MKFFAVIPTLLAACAAEAQLPIAAQYLGGAGLYNGLVGSALPYAGAYGAYAPAAYGAAVDAKFAYGAPITALNAGPLTPAPVSAVPAVAAAPAAIAAYTATPAITTASYAPAYPTPVAAYAAAPVAPVAAAAPVAAYAAAPVAAYAAAPVAAYAAAPVASAPIAGPVSSQFQAQDEFGNLAYGYNNINSAKQERGNALGGVTGSYTYQDEAGVHTVNYVADDFGFRVAGDNLPVAPVYTGAAPVAPVYTGVAPAAVVDTPEVAAAKAEFFQAYDAATKTKRSAVAPVAYSAPAAPAREAIRTTIQLNPGHAIFYRVGGC